MNEAEFFDSMYANAAGDDAAVPWQGAMSRSLINEWIDGATFASGTRAMVVAAGLGDDAAALARRGLDVTAFDFSPTAVDWARTRHGDVDVDWHQADLFDLPDEWSGSFDLVVEVFTIQSTPPDRQPEAADAVRRLVAPGGTLVAILLEHLGSDEPSGPPWPLATSTVDRLVTDLSEVERHTIEVRDDVVCHRIELTRPA